MKYSMTCRACGSEIERDDPQALRVFDDKIRMNILKSVGLTPTLIRKIATLAELGAIDNDKTAIQVLEWVTKLQRGDL